MKNIITTLVVLSSFGILQACTAKLGSPEAKLIAKKESIEKAQDEVEEVVDNIPDWCVNPPQSGVAIYVCGDSTSTTLTMARHKALMRAKAEVASNMGGKLSLLGNLYMKETGTGDNVQVQENIEQIIKSSTSEVLISGYQVVETKTLAVGSKYKHFLLLEYPIGEANQAFVNQVKENEILSTLDAADAAMAELEAEIEKKREGS